MATRLIEEFTLEFDLPGQVVSMSLDSSRVRSILGRHETIDINYRQLFKKLTGRKRGLLPQSISNTQTSSIAAKASVAAALLLGPMAGGSPMPMGGSSFKPSSNRLESIIDKLERKYYAPATISDYDISQSPSDADSMSSSRHSQSMSPSDTPPDKTGKKSAAKRKVASDTYDYDDPFLDTSEEVLEFQGAIEAKRRKKKGIIGGYMVSAGNVEHELVPEEDLLPYFDKQEREEKVQVPEHTIESPLNAAILTKSGADLTEQAPTSPKKSDKVEKIVWQPAPMASLALESFQTFALESGFKVGKTTQFPVELELPLLDLDTVVMKHHSAKEMNRTIGYYEAIQASIGGVVPVGRIKTLITKVRSRERAKELLKQWTSSIDSFLVEVKECLIPCSEEKQPSNNKKKTKDDNNTADAADEEAATGEEKVEEKEAAVVATTDTPIVYQWYCKWTIPLRQKLSELKELISDWVTAENEFREKLTMADKKDMEEKDFSYLSPFEEDRKLFARISQTFPPLCLNSDVASLRKAIRTEKKRQNK